MKKHKVAKFLKRLTALSLVMILIFGVLLYMRPLPEIQPVTTLRTPDAASILQLPWPSYGQAALGAQGYGVLETHGNQTPAPIASVAKVMTAYAVLKQKPLSAGQQGPMITITAADVAIYNDYVAKDGSVAKVEQGEQISEYQALQAMLLPSANNFADTLANWAYGSMDKYIEQANSYAVSLGMKNTHISDASGFSPQTTSSATDLVILGDTALQNPVIADIVSQKSATIPVAGTINNVNWLLGTDGINGIKTGNTDQAGGCFLFSAKHTIDGHDITLIGAIVSAPDLMASVNDSKPLIAAIDKGFSTVTAVRPGQTVGYYQAPWGTRVEVTAKNNLNFFTWRGQNIQVTTKLDSIKAPENTGKKVGTITASVDKQKASTEVELSQKLSAPSWTWRIFSR